MAKKKKTTNVKSVVRGFATTSTPKKLVPVVEEEVASPPEAGQEAESAHQEPISDGGFDNEQTHLQGLVDRLRDKTEKEVVRTIQAVEVDRRYSKTFSSLDLHPVLVGRILDLAVTLSNDEGARRSIDIPHDKFLSKLAIIYGALRRLGFTEERVIQCLQGIGSADLEEACDWLFTHCTDDEVNASEPGRSIDNAIPQRDVAPPNANDQTDVPSSSSSQLTVSRSATLDPNAMAFVPRCNVSPIPSKQEIPIPIETPKDWRIEDPNAEYVRLTLELDELGSQKRQAQTIKALKKSIEAVKGHYFFDEKTAIVNYESEKQKRASVKLAFLRGDAETEEPSPKDSNFPPSPPPPASIPIKSDPPDVFDEESEGGMFELLEEMPISGTTEEGTTYIVKDLASPKQWAGRTPKICLSDLVSKSDKYAILSYTNVSGASRAVRVRVSIRWNGGSTQVWSMDTVACHNQQQAENYAATLALHSLVFPSTDGFASGTPGVPGGATLFRTLPAVFRDLWDELELERRRKDDEVNRRIWGKLENITLEKESTSQKASVKTVKPVTESGQSQRMKGSREISILFREQLKSSFEQRQSSSAYQEMLEQRNQLPIAHYRKDIIDALERAQVLVLSGETGCGKSTQLPSFILEDQLSQGNPCKIFCTEPRRISAVSLAQRVSRELGDAPNAVGTNSSLVGYSIRLESNISKNTRLAFVTNGIALRMFEGGSGQGGQGTAFDEITHIIVDEVHERTIESDFLLIVLKSMIQVRPSLRVVLMSATVDSEKISRYFNDCPIIHVPGRTFPVRVNYLEDAIDFTQWTIKEKSQYARRPHDRFQGKNRPEWLLEAGSDSDDESSGSQDAFKLEKKYSANTISTVKLFDERLIPYELIVRLMEDVCYGERYKSFSAAILIFMPGIGEIRRLNDMLIDHENFGNEDEYRLYPLHSTLSSENQGAVFDIPPPGVCKIVIATNIAETGITIPDITCVIDTGKHREMRFDEKRQTSRLVETFVAKSNAAQRRGRAGRVQEGICFHLFTKFRHDSQMVDNPLPEMMRLGLSDLALRIKIMKVNLGDSVEDVLSRALDPPLSVNIQRAVSMLVEVGALTPSEEITAMGKLLSTLPTNVHLGKFLLTAVMLRCLDPALTIAAALNAKSPFLSPMGQEDEAKRAKMSFRIDNSDFLTIHNVFASWRKASGNSSFIRKFCRDNYLSHQNLQQIEELRQQFLGYLIDSSFINVDAAFIRDLNRARYTKSWNTRFINIPAELDINTSNIAVINAALACGLYPKIISVTPSNEMRTLSNNQVAYFHPSSVNFGCRAGDLGSKHLAYFTLMHSRKLYAWETAPVDELAILLLCGDAEFKLLSDMVIVDRKLKFRVSPKVAIALKMLRTNFLGVLGAMLRGKVLKESQLLWYDLGMLVLGKANMDEDREPVMTIK